MATCPSCDVENPSSFRFCGACGGSLVGTSCAACGFANPVENRFCGRCGLGLASEVTATEAHLEERKLATVLFADVVGFTSLSERTDAEAVARAVDGAFRRLGDVVVEHGGTIDKYMGDSMMALFGVPQAHDDDAERAVAAGLAMRGLGGDLAFSIGINTGEVIVTSLGGGTTTVLGDAVNVAARLEKTAGPGEVLVGPLTAQLAAPRVMFRPRPAVLLAGKEQPVEVHEAVAVAPSAVAGVDAVDWPPMVDRVAERDLLTSQWRRVVDECEPVPVLVTGEAGVGKTRLVEAFNAQLGDEALVVHASYPAYGMMGGQRVASEIAAALGPSGDTEVDARVRSITGLKDEFLRDIDPGTLHHEQLWAVRRLFEMKAAERPLVIVLDDMHRAGEGSLQFVETLLARVQSVPLLLLLVGRPEPPGWLRRFGPTTTLQLAPLGQAESLTLVHELAKDEPLVDETARLLARRSGGNPLYLRELVAIARETSRLHADAARDAALGVPVPDAPLPPTLRSILAARLDFMAPEEKLAIQHLAVLGQRGTADQVTAFGLPDADARLNALADGGLLRRHGDEPFFVIADPLLAEVAYEALPHRVRAERHRVAAEIAATAEERARHLDRAAVYAPDDSALVREAAAALVEAGCTLLDEYRYADGVALLQRALELEAATPETLLRLAGALNILGRGDELLAVLDRLGTQTDPALEAERVHLRASGLSFTEPEAALALFDDAEARWSSLGNVTKHAWTLANRGPVLFTLSRMREASASLHRAVELFRSVGDRGGEHAALSFLGLIHPEDPRVAGWLEDSLQYAEEIGDRSRQVAAVIPLAWHHYLRARFGGDRDIESARLWATRLEDRAAEVAGMEWRAHGVCIDVNLRRLAGMFAADDAERVREFLDDPNPRVAALAATTLFDLAITDAKGSGLPPPARFDSPDPVIGIAQLIAFEALVLGGRAAEALAHYAGGDFPARLPSVNALVPGLSIALAEVLEGRFDRARTRLEGAMSIAEVLESNPGAAAARALLAEVVLRTEGDVSTATKLVTEAAELATGGISGALVLRARALLGDDAAAAMLHPESIRLRAPGIALHAVYDARS